MVCMTFGDFQLPSFEGPESADLGEWVLPVNYSPVFYTLDSGIKTLPCRKITEYSDVFLGAWFWYPNLFA